MILPATSIEAYRRGLEAINKRGRSRQFHSRLWGVAARRAWGLWTGCGWPAMSAGAGCSIPAGRIGRSASLDPGRARSRRSGASG